MHRILLIAVILVGTLTATERMETDSSLTILGVWSQDSSTSIISTQGFSFINQGALIHSYLTVNPDIIQHFTQFSARGPVEDMAIIPNGLVTAEGSQGISFFSLGNPENVLLFGSIIPEMEITRIATGNNINILAATGPTSSIQLYYIDDIFAPELVATIEPERPIHDMVIWNAFLYVFHTDGWSCYSLYDHSNPELLYESETGPAGLSAAFGEFQMAISLSDSSVVLYDEYMTGSPLAADTLHLDSPAISSIIRGSILYLLKHNGIVDLFDIVTEDVPVYIMSLPGDGHANDMAMDSNGLISLAYEGAGLRVVEANQTDHYTTMTFTPIPGLGAAFQISEGYVYIADGFSGLSVLELADPYDPVYVTTVEAVENVIGLDVKGSLAVLACELGGLTTFDVSDPESPEMLTNMPVEGEAMDVVYREAYAYLAAGGGGCQLVDLSDPSAPQVVFTFPESEMCFAVDVRDNLLAFGNFLELFLFDITDPLEPVALGACFADGEISDIDLKGDMAYLASDMGMHIVDISEPSAPFLVSTWEAFTMPMFGAVDVFDTRAVLLADMSIDILNISDPENIQLAQSVETDGNELLDVRIERGRIYLSGAMAFRVMGAGDFRVAGDFRSHYEPFDLTLYRDNVIVASGNGGMTHLDLEPLPEIAEVGFDLEGDGTRMTRYENYIFAMGRDGNFKSVRIGNTHLILRDTLRLELDSMEYALHSNGDVTGMIASNGAYHLVDTSQPYRLERLGTSELSLTGTKPSLHLTQTRSVVTAGSQVIVLNISEPADVGILHDWTVEGSCLAVNDSLLFIIDDSDQLLLYDWRGEAPVLLPDGLPLDFSPETGFNSEGFLFLAGLVAGGVDSSQVLMVDVFTPGSPRIIGGITLAGGVTGMDRYEERLAIVLSTGQVVVTDNAYFGIVSWEDTPQPLGFTLHDNYPNPFNSSTQISFDLPAAAMVDLKIFNILGQVVDHAFTGDLPAGSYAINWDSKALATGVYIYTLQVDNQRYIRKMTLIK